MTTEKAVLSVVGRCFERVGTEAKATQSHVLGVRDGGSLTFHSTVLFVDLLLPSLEIEVKESFSMWIAEQPKRGNVHVPVSAP